MQTYLGYKLANPSAPAFVPSIYTSAGVVVSGVVSTPNKKQLLTLATGHSNSGTDLYILFFETTAVPSAGAIPAYEMPLPARSLFSWSPSQEGRVFNSLSFAVSTTPGAYTVSVATVWMDIEGGRL